MQRLAPIESEIGERLARFRGFSLLSQPALAESIGSTRDEIASYECTKAALPFRYAVALAQKHELSLSWLASGHGGMKSKFDHALLDRSFPEKKRFSAAWAELHIKPGITFTDEDREHLAYLRESIERTVTGWDSLGTEPLPWDHKNHPNAEFASRTERSLARTHLRRSAHYLAEILHPEKAAVLMQHLEPVAYQGATTLTPEFREIMLAVAHAAHIAAGSGPEEQAEAAGA